MADTQLTADATSQVEQEDAIWGVYSQGDNRVGFGVSAAKDLVALYNEAAGAPTTVAAAEAGTVVALAVWYDRETPGDTGNLLHCVWVEHGATSTGAFKYASFDISNPSGVGWSAVTTIASSLATDSVANTSKCYITKARDGVLHYGYEINDASNNSYKGSPSSPTGALDVYEGNGGDDYCFGFPANTADSADIGVVYGDASANAYSVKMYDNSANTWTETAIVTVTNVYNVYTGVDLTVRASDGHVLVAMWEDALNSIVNEDLLSYDLTVDSIASPTVTAKTSVHVTAASGELNSHVGMFINRQTDDVYCAYMRSATSTNTDGVVYYRKSTDGMGTWGSEQAYQEDAGGDQRGLHAGRVVDNAGGAFMPMFHDDVTTDYWVNLTNDVVITVLSVTFESMTNWDNNGAASDFPIINMPATRPDGDLYILALGKDNLSSADADVTISGWTQIDTAEDAGTWSGFVYYRVGSSEPASYASNDWGTVRGAVASVLRFSGAGTPTSLSSHANSSTSTAPARTGAASTSIIVRFWCIENDNAGDNPPAGHTTRDTPVFYTGGFNDVFASVATDDTPGATDAATYGGTYADNWVAFSIEIPVATIAGFNAIRQDILDGITSAQSEGTGWNAEVRDKAAVGTVVRTSDTIVTVTLPATAGYNVTAGETITVTVPAAAVTSAAALVATPTFVVGVTPNAVQILLNSYRRRD